MEVRFQHRFWHGGFEKNVLLQCMRFLANYGIAINLGGVLGYIAFLSG